MEQTQTQVTYHHLKLLEQIVVSNVAIAHVRRLLKNQTVEQDGEADPILHGNFENEPHK